MISNNIPRDIIIKFLKFYYADGTTNGSGSCRLSVIEYKKENINDFIEINKYFNSRDFIEKCVEGFILKGRNSQHSIDILLLRKVNDFFYINKNEIYDIITQTKIDSTSIHIGPLFVQPLSRNLNRNSKYEKSRYIIQIKWYSLFDDILKYKSGCSKSLIM